MVVFLMANYARISRRGRIAWNSHSLNRLNSGKPLRDWFYRKEIFASPVTCAGGMTSCISIVKGTKYLLLFASKWTSNRLLLVHLDCTLGCGKMWVLETTGCCSIHIENASLLAVIAIWRNIPWAVNQSVRSSERIFVIGTCGAEKILDWNSPDRRPQQCIPKGPIAWWPFLGCRKCSAGKKDNVPISIFFHRRAFCFRCGRRAFLSTKFLVLWSANTTWSIPI